MSFAQALAFTLKEEGGYVDDPRDRGGATNQGVTQATYDRYRRGKGLTPRDVRGMDSDEVADLYQSLFWSPAHCDALARPLSICHFDWAVNHGVPGALRTLQGALGVAADGVFGPDTQAAADAADPMPTVARYLGLRRAWYLAHVEAEPDQGKFLAGWLARIERLQTYLETSA